MEFVTILWDDANVEHIAEHGLTMDDVEDVLCDPFEKSHSRTTGHPLYKGFTADGRIVYVVFEQVDAVTARPITAYEVEPNE